MGLLYLLLCTFVEETHNKTLTSALLYYVKTLRVAVGRGIVKSSFKLVTYNCTAWRKKADIPFSIIYDFRVVQKI